MGFLRRQVLTAALAANAVRPLRGERTAVPAFAAGMLVGELAPQIAAVVAGDAAREVLAGVRGRRTPSRAGLALAAASVGALGWLTLGATRTAAHVETNLRDGLGDDYLDVLEDAPTLDLRLPLRQLVRPFKLTRPGVEVIRDVSYTKGGRRARLDIYRPEGVDLRGAPVLLQVHGGAWTVGSKEQQGLLLMNAMAERGWVCVAVNYRLAPKHPWPAQIVDVKRAIAWTHRHIAEYGGDPDYLVTTGGSAGGHLAALAALTPGDPPFQPGFEDEDTSVAACVPFYGVYDLAGLTGDKPATAMRDHFLGPRVFQRDPRTELEVFEQASPLTHVTPEAPDFFILHGTHDSLVDVRQARRFVGRLKEVSRRSVTYAELPGAQHAFEVFGSIRGLSTTQAAERWLLHHRTLWEREQAEQAAS